MRYISTGFYRIQSGEPYTQRRLRPLARRADKTARPPLVAIRERNPWHLARLRVLGWYVRFISKSLSFTQSNFQIIYRKTPMSMLYFRKLQQTIHPSHRAKGKQTTQNGRSRGNKPMCAIEREAECGKSGKLEIHSGRAVENPSRKRLPKATGKLPPVKYTYQLYFI